MIKVTVLYNLPPGADEEAFLRWRTTDHHRANIARPGVIRSDFYKVAGTPLLGPDRPPSSNAPYRFITEAYYADLQTFEQSWNDPDEQARLLPAIAKIDGAVFLVSEEVQSYSAD